MTTEYLDYRDTGFFSKTVLDYLEGSENLNSLYNVKPIDSSFDELIAQRVKHPVNRTLLVKVLEEQYSRISSCGGNIHSKVTENISALKNEETFTVTTGHQLNIFTGPLYTIYKILGTISLSRKLALRYPNKRIIPVFWLATEDHDFAEINHLTLGDKTISWNLDASGAVGRLSTETIQPILGKLLSSIGLSTYYPLIEQVLKKAYLNNETLADATRYLYNELFGSYGLVIIDADEKELKKEFSSIIELDILEQNSFNAVQKRTGNSRQKVTMYKFIHAR